MEERKSSRSRGWTTAVLIGLAALMTAWCAFQAIIWNGEQSFRLADANVAGRQQQNARAHHDLVVRLDVELYVQWLDAHFSGDRRKMARYRAAFRPDFAPAFEAWLQLAPARNPAAPAHPFAMAAYAPRERHSVEHYRSAGRIAVAAAELAHRTGDEYVLATVLFALVLFFAGIAQAFAANIRTVLLVAGGVFFVGAALLVLRLPVRVAADPLDRTLGEVDE